MTTIDKTITHGITIGAGGSYTSPLDITKDGGVLSSAGVAIVGAGAAAYTIDNAGLVYGHQSGISLRAGGSIGNAGTLEGKYGIGIDFGKGAGTLTNGGFIYAGGNEAVTFGGSGVVDNSGSIFGNHGNAIAVAGTANITNGGVIVAGKVAVSVVGEGFVTNSGTLASLSGDAIDLGHGGTLRNYGSILGGTLSIRGTQVVGAGYGVSIGGLAGTVMNSGTGAVLGGDKDGVLLGVGGSVNNAGTIEGFAGDGVLLDAAGSVYNTGTIFGYAEGVFIRGAGELDNKGTVNGVVIEGTAASLDNSGTVEGVVSFSAGGSVDNGGVLLNLTGVGIDITGSAGTVTNSGTIAGLPRDIYLGAGGSVDNSGTIDLRKALEAPAGPTVIAAADDPSSTGIEIAGGVGTVTNSGSVAGLFGFAIDLEAGGSVDNSGYVLGEGATGIDLAAAGTVTNTGSIREKYGYSLSSKLFYYAVEMSGGGSLANLGTGAISGGVEFSGGTGRVTNAGTLAGAYGDGVRLKAGGTVIDYGTIRAGTFGSAADYAIAFGGAGSNLLVLEQGYSISGKIAGSDSAGASNTLELSGSRGAVSVDYNRLSLGHFGDIRFSSAGNETLRVSNTSGTLPVTILGFNGSSDTIDLTAIGTDGSIVGTAGDRLTIAGSSGMVALQLTTQGAGDDGSHFTTQSDQAGGTELIACFCRGTQILTETGEVPVERLRIGDAVVTAAGAVRPVKWIGRRSYEAASVAGNRNILPIVIRAGALGDGVPRRDLRLSPHHAVFLESVLVPAEHLVNGMTILQSEAVEPVDYFHLELASHDVIFAEGAPAESFVDCDSRQMFHNAAEFAELYPGENPPRFAFCAPRVEEGSALAAIRGRIETRALERAVDAWLAASRGSADFDPAIGLLLRQAARLIARKRELAAAA